MVTYNIRLDETKPGSQCAIQGVRVGEGNARSINIMLHSGSTPVTIPAGAIVLLQCAKPDGTECLESTVIDSGIIRVGISEQMCAVEGTVNCEVKVYNAAQTQVLYSAFFDIYVQEALSESGIVSSNEYSALSELITNAQELQGAWGNAVATAQTGDSTGVDVTVGDDSVSFAFTLEKGEKGDAGVSVTVGSTTTGAAGTQASVTNSGTASDPVLDFVIPQGAPGAGVPAGGTAGQILAKASGADFDTAWADANYAAASHASCHASDGADPIKIGSTADLPVFTLSGGAIGVKNVADAKIALNITPHNYLYGGRNLSEIFTAAQLHAAVEAGDFSNIRIGDYWPITLNGSYHDYGDNTNKTLSNAVVNLEVAGIDTFLQYSNNSITQHHLVMVSRDCLPITMKMRSADATWTNTAVTNPWLGSAAYKTLNDASNGLIKLVAATSLGAYIYAGPDEKGMRFLGETKAAGETEAASWGWLDRGKLFLPTEREVWGQDVWSEHDCGGGVPIQYPIFQGGLRHIIKGLGNGGSCCLWWCSSSLARSAAYFCPVSGDGVSGRLAASTALGVPLCFLFA